MAGLTTTSSSKEVTVDQMDYGYINKCSDEKELERILKALKSGREGFFPDLINHCEKKLEAINPQSRVLRKQQPILTARDLDREQQQNLKNELDQWTDAMNLPDPRTDESKSLPNGFGDHSKLPPIRGSRVLKGNRKKKSENGGAKNSNPDRIKSNDYKAWDKFDVDKECDKVNEEERKPVPKPMKIDLPAEIDATGLTEEEREMKALREKEKGNEAFKSGDFEEALSYYCRSISLRPIAASYNNRALVYLRLERWQDAKNDCNTVLSFDGEKENLKAMLRRSTACKALGLYNEAKTDLFFVLEKEPNNARAKSILADVEKLEAAEEKKKFEDSQTENEDEAKSGKKMVIQEVDGDSEEEDNDEDTATPDVQTESYQTPAAPPLTTDGKNTPKKFEGGDSPKESDASDSANLNAKATESLGREPPASQKVDDTIPTSQHDQKIAEKPPQEEVTQSPPVEPKFPASTQELKIKAGDFFRSGRYAEACEEYTKAIKTMSTLLKAKSIDRGHELANAVLLNNRAACWLKQGNDRACIEDCTKVLETKVWDVKAFTRRAVAYEHMEKYALAWVDYQSAYNMGRDNALAQSGANRVAKHLREIHGVTWREKMPKVHHYPHHNAHTWVAPMHNKVVDMETKVDPETPPESIKSSPAAEETVKKQPEIGGQGSEKGGQSPDVSPPPGSSPTAKEKGSERKLGTTTQKQTKRSRKRNKSKSKPTKKIEEKEEEIEKHQAEQKKLQIRQDIFEKFKSDGNDFVKKGDYSSAVDCYTKCITYCPKEPASYTNRALCFLKLKKHVSAVNDCTEAIKLDPVNVKAYYRRAQARKAEGHFKDAERDIKKLLEIDPGNKAARNELESLKIIAWDAARAKQEVNSANERKKCPPRKKQLVIEEVDSSSSSEEGEFILPKEEAAQSERVKKNRKSSNDDLENSVPKSEKNEPVKGKPQPSVIAQNSDDTGNKGTEDTADTKVPDLPETEERPSTSPGPSDEPLTDASGGKSQDAPSPEIPKTKEKPVTNPGSSNKPQTDTSGKQSQDVPTAEVPDPPETKQRALASPSPSNKTVTPYEFGNAWNSITDKQNVQAYKLLLDPITPNDLPKLISNNIDDHVIITVTEIALEYAKSDYQRAYDLMYHLTKAKRFSMAAMFLTDAQHVPLQALFKVLSEHKDSVYTKDELVKLRNEYCLS